MQFEVAVRVKLILQTLTLILKSHEALLYGFCYFWNQRQGFGKHLTYSFYVYGQFQGIISYYELLNMCAAVHIKLRNASSLLSSSYFEIVECKQNEQECKRTLKYKMSACVPLRKIQSIMIKNMQTSSTHTRSRLNIIVFPKVLLGYGDTIQ